jgi:hypothetical protein
MAHCPNCGGQLKIIAAILEQPVIEKILTHLGLQADSGRMPAPARSCASGRVRACQRERGLQGRAPPRAPARGSQLQAA